jgi:hypothetical protein
MAGLSSRLRLAPAGTLPDISIDKDGEHFGAIRISDYTQNGILTARVYEVTWSPTVDAIKERQFAVDESYDAERVYGDKYLKTYLMNERLADPVLYVGTYRQHMQYPLLRGIESVLKDFAPRDELAIFTYSLGSYMTYDTLLAMSEGRPILGDANYSASSVRALIGHTNYIYMLANQLPLLELSEVRGPAHSEKMPDAVNQLSQVRAEHFRQSRLERQISPIHLHLVAFTDPNDLLSYPLGNTNVMESGSDQIAYSDVMISVAHSALLDLAVNPITAHTGHDKDRRVLDLIAHGWGH